MTTIAEFEKSLPKKALKVAIYNALGEDLTTELASAGCELIIHDDLETYEFLNITPDLQAKIDLKKRKQSS
jgi:hypothetical protein